MLASIGNAFVEGVITPLPTGAGSSRRVSPQKYEPVAVLSMEKLAKLAGMKVPEPEPLVKEPTVPGSTSLAAPVRSPLRVKLLGTLFGGAGVVDRHHSRRGDVESPDVHGGRQPADREGAGDQRERVIILNNNRREYIDATAGDGQGIPAPVVAAVRTSNDAPPPSQNLGAGVKQVSENEYEVPRGEIDKTLANLNEVAMQARIVPAFKDGSGPGLQALLHPPGLDLLEDRRAERRRDPPHQRLRSEQPGEGARGLHQAEGSLPHRDRDRAQRSADPQDVQRPLTPAVQALP